jgi:hypothetical protein
MNTQDPECCPEFHVEKWDNKTLSWDQKPFIKESVPTLFHMPFPPMIAKKMKRMCDLVERAEADIPDMSDALVLFHDPSAFRSEIYYSVTKDVAGANNTHISGTFETRVFDGPYNAIPTYIKKMEGHLANKGQKPADYYVHYAYCPNCAKKFGHNYMILFAKVQS